MRRSYVLIAAIALLAVALVPAVAFGNAGVHGNYVMNTDACAGCHRAHTAPSTITWVDGAEQTKSALLISTATDIESFCLVCHDTAGQGAETNVEGGQYNVEIDGLYGTDGAPLNGGAFGRQILDINGNPTRVDAWGRNITSVHSAPGGWGIFGGGASAAGTDSTDASGGTLADGNWGGPVISALSCDTCHDVHGSSNYRILKDVVWGNKVGGYDDSSVDATNPNPTPFVQSCEPNFPIGGFRLHTEYGTYKPNYTTPMYARPPGNDKYKGMVGWCTGCHSQYSKDSTYSAGDTHAWDGAMRYRHAVNVPMSNFKPVSRSLIVTDNPLPLAHDIDTEAGDISNTGEDWIECLTCHNAHGTSAVMTGYANVSDPSNPVKDTGMGGTPPDTGSGLLKMNNRGVCENCHNK